MLQMFVLSLSLYNTIEFKVSFFYAKSRTCSFIVSNDIIFSKDSDFVQLEIPKEGFTMKKIGLGIAILLFAIVISLCSSGIELLSIGIGIVGLIFSIIGFMECK